MVKKKESQKERREREKREMLAKHVSVQIDKPSRKSTVEHELKVVPPLNKKNCIKSKVKANGLKSMLKIDDKLVLVGFGRGNEAVIETQFSGEEQERILDPGTFDAENEPRSIKISSARFQGIDSGHALKPVNNGDKLGLKSKLENRYFGQSFDDNLHIQLIHNILDIEKLLAVHIENIIYSINNVLEDGIIYEDYIGFKFKQDDNDDQETFNNLVNNPRLRYFGSAFYESGFDKKSPKTSTRRSDEEIRVIFNLLNKIRNFVKHGDSKAKYRMWLYTLNTHDDLATSEKDFLDKLYATRINDLNKNFVVTSKVNLTILFDVLNLQDDDERKKCVQDYYNYVIRKENRNLGFSLKDIRELIIATNYGPRNAINLSDKKYDTVRSKLYKLIDFVLLRDYLNNDVLREDMVAKLRCALTTEDRDKVYRDETDACYKRNSKIIDAICEKIYGGNAIKDIEINIDLKQAKEWLTEVKLTPQGADYFTKLMYMLTLFLDGKEINILLTSLINKFENIGAFVELIKELNLPLFNIPEKTNARNYTFFLNSSTIAQEIRVMKNFARMEVPLPAISWGMYKDALLVLGLPKEKLENYNGVIVGQGKEQKTSVQKSDTSLRNFLANNVLESSRFRYLIRFSNPLLVRQLIQNKQLVSFVLNQIPETQLRRYYKACVNDFKELSKGQVILELSDSLVTFSFENNKVSEVKQNDLKSTASEKERKQKLVSIIGLYLTIPYLIVKNLVNINSRYTLAFHCFERDRDLFITNNSSHPHSWYNLVEGYIAAEEDYQAERRAFVRITKDGRKKTGKRINGRWLSIVKQNYGHLINCRASADAIIKVYRDAIAHLFALSEIGKYISDIEKVDSYFEVYHYVMQRYLQNPPESVSDKYKEYLKDDQDQMLLDYLKKTETYHTYQKDLLWLLNIPFAYNLPRYKNLCVAELFADKEKTQNN